MWQRFGFDLSMEAVRLMKRGDGFWYEEVVEKIDGPDILDRLEALVAMVPEGEPVEIFLPGDQILYVDVPVRSTASAALDIRRALDGRTPYAIEELAFDWEPARDNLVRVAAIARDTLDEAAAFAEVRGLVVARYSSLAEPSAFPRLPDFGTGPDDWASGSDAALLLVGHPVAEPWQDAAPVGTEGDGPSHAEIDTRAPEVSHDDEPATPEAFEAGGAPRLERKSIDPDDTDAGENQPLDDVEHAPLRELEPFQTGDAASDAAEAGDRPEASTSDETGRDLAGRTSEADDAADAAEASGDWLEEKTADEAEAPGARFGEGEADGFAAEASGDRPEEETAGAAEAPGARLGGGAEDDFAPEVPVARPGGGEAREDAARDAVAQSADAPPPLSTQGGTGTPAVAETDGPVVLDGPPAREGALRESSADGTGHDWSDEAVWTSDDDALASDKDAADAVVAPPRAKDTPVGQSPVPAALDAPDDDRDDAHPAIPMFRRASRVVPIAEADADTPVIHVTDPTPVIAAPVAPVVTAARPRVVATTRTADPADASASLRLRRDPLASWQGRDPRKRGRGWALAAAASTAMTLGIGWVVWSILPEGGPVVEVGAGVETSAGDASSIAPVTQSRDDALAIETVPPGDGVPVEVAEATANLPDLPAPVAETAAPGAPLPPDAGIAAPQAVAALEAFNALPAPGLPQSPAADDWTGPEAAPAPTPEALRQAAASAPAAPEPPAAAEEGPEAGRAVAALDRPPLSAAPLPEAPRDSGFAPPEALPDELAETAPTDPAEDAALAAASEPGADDATAPAGAPSLDAGDATASADAALSEAGDAPRVSDAAPVGDTPLDADPFLADAAPDAEPGALPAPTELARSLKPVAPRARPLRLVETAERARFGGRTREELSRIRPPARPDSAQSIAVASRDTAAPAGSGSLLPPDAEGVLGRQPRTRPEGFEDTVRDTLARQASLAPAPDTSAAVRAALARPPEATQEAVDTARQTSSMVIPSGVNVARRATIENVFDMKSLALVGVYGSTNDRRALLRLANGRYVKVKAGDRVDGGTVAAIGATSVTYRKGGRNVSLQMPGG